MPAPAGRPEDTDAERRAYLESWGARLRTVFEDAPIAFPPLEAYDETFRLKHTP